MKNKPGRKLYSVAEIYGIAVKAFRSSGDLKRLRQSNVLTEELQERVMLAVTSVNKCAMCSYAHTKMALKAGVQDEEIKGILAGDFPDVPPEDSRAVLFGQYYAECRGKPEEAIWNELTAAYGPELATGILAAARTIMMGNSLGIVFGSVSGRLHGKGGDSRSSVVYELAVLLTLLPFMLAAFLQAGVCNLLRVPKIRFPKNCA